MADAINNKLIELIRDRPCLYDPNHSGSNSFQVKEKHWSEIAKNLGTEATFLKKRWKVIRDRYRKEWNTINNDPYTKRESSWRPYKQLSYLEPHMTSRSFALLPKFEPIESQPKFEHSGYDDFSEYMEVLESESEDEPNDAIQPQTVLEHSRLIETVKAMPNLYDPQNYNYNSRHIRQIAWEQIAKDLDSSVISVMRKWQELCDRFRREHKNATDNGNAFPQYVSSFEYYDQLSFLIDGLHRKRSSSHDLEAEIFNYNDLSHDEDDLSYQYLKEEEDVSSEANNNCFQLDDRDCKLAQLVRNNPMLYDEHHQNFKDTPMRNRKWMQLSFELGQDVNSLKSRWQTIQEQYRMYNPSDNNDPNSRKLIELLAFLDQNSNACDSDTASNVKFEIDSNESIDEYADSKISIITPVKIPAGHTHISSSSSSHHSPSTTNPVAHDSSSCSHIKMFFDSVAAQVEAENLPFRHFSIIQQEVLKVVHQQISSYLEQQ